ncbi:atrial natriuretic peptide receptor 2-like isoform X2 [Paramacrobiotus metropolitanus]|uniref:atrial natriuretic peptide receptor 2-like isoform X2 n=1 Tax=Paramacrobiotus metropolitanus TaxID=2943436 RepID=UPI0024457930|nr:atrial natriuretic peptide receptor 2-like isoform X2 [Paramacrobiotus metropolitanus]
MDTGKFVFLAIHFPDMSVVQKQQIGWDTDDEITRVSRRLLPFWFEITAMNPPTARLIQEWRKVTSEARSNYGTDIPTTAQLNLMQMSAYASVYMALQILNDHYDDLHDMDGMDLTKLFLNNTFHTPGQIITVGPDGMRLTDVFIKQYDNQTFVPTLTWVYSAETESLSFVVNGNFSWPGSNGFLPANSFPPCVDRICVDASTVTPGTYALDTFLGILGISIIIIICLYCRRKTELVENSWWMVENADIVDLTTNPTVFRFAGLAVPFVDNYDGTPKFQNALYKTFRVQAAHVANIKRIDDVLQNRAAIAVLKQIRECNHPNLGKFFGLLFPSQWTPTSKRLLAIVECGQKGLLRNYIDQDDLAFSWDLRFSLIWDLFRALEYIGRISLRIHGALDFSCLIIDEHFSLKIVRLGMHQLQQSLQSSQKSAESFPRICRLWMAPEVLRNANHAYTPAADIFSLGVILYEIATRKTPFNVDVFDPVAVEAMVERVKNGFLKPSTYEIKSTHPTIVDLIYRSWAFNPETRPSIGDFMHGLNIVHPHTNISFTDSLLIRLQKYNLELEGIVADRTIALREEADKVDKLLGNMLPKSIAKELRDKKYVQPEFFESVSVMFSEIPAFKLVVTCCSPLMIVELLHNLYSILDTLIPSYDVYKVEAITDLYMIASGLPARNGIMHAQEIGRLSLQMLRSTHHLTCLTDGRDARLILRIGINSGPCVGVVIGKRLPHYVLVGDTVNTASRIETNGEESKVHISEVTKCLLDVTGNFITEPRGQVCIKGKGSMTTYWLLDTVDGLYKSPKEFSQREKERWHQNGENQ